jgi:hypothetical protein
MILCGFVRVVGNSFSGFLLNLDKRHMLVVWALYSMFLLYTLSSCRLNLESLSTKFAMSVLYNLVLDLPLP